MEVGRHPLPFMYTHTHTHTYIYLFDFLVHKKHTKQQTGTIWKEDKAEE